MTPTARFATGVVTLVALAGSALAMGVGVIRPADGVGTPSHSSLHLIEDLFPARHLTAADIRRGGRTCLAGTRLVVAPGTGCTFILPAGVHVAVFRRVPATPGMTVTVSQTVDLTQTADTAQAGPDLRDPLRLRFGAIHDGTTVTLSGCRGPGACDLDLSQ